MAAGNEDGPAYWTQWQVFVCAVIFIGPAAAAAAVISRFKGEKLRSVALWLPCWRGLHPVWLLAYRVLALVSMSCVLFPMVLPNPAFAFYFYTQWTFTLVILYFTIATLVSAHGCWIYSKQHINEKEEVNEFLNEGLEVNSSVTFKANEEKDANMLRRHHGPEFNANRAGFWGYAMQVVYQTSAGAVMLTDVVFWGLLVPFMSSEHFNVTLIEACMHSLNAVFLLVDTALNSLPFPWFRMAYFVLWTAIYVTFQWVMHLCGFSWWPYPFLERARALYTLGTIMVFMHGAGSYPMLWLLLDDCKSKEVIFP